MNKQVKYLLKNYNSKQRTPEWFKKRYNSLTASDIASALEANPYQTKLELLKKKCSKIEDNSSDNYATQWGTLYEDVALRIFEETNKKSVNSIGLVSHREIPWLKASPDGILNDGTLIEIKCPISRKIGYNIPHQYWIQVQIQLEVCDFDKCIFYQCKFNEYRSKKHYDQDENAIKGIINKNRYWKLDKCTENIISRDKKWFRKVYPSLKRFWNDVIHYRKCGNEYLEATINRKRKRSEDNINEIDIDKNNDKRTRLSNNKDYLIQNWNEWISVTDITNYIINDPILDWFNYYGERNNYKKSYDHNTKFNEYLSLKGKLFENNNINILRINYNINAIANYGEEYSIKKFNETVDNIKKGVPIIYNGLLHDINEKIYAIPTLLVRLDYFNKIFNQEIIDSSNSLDKYCIVEIKNITLYLNSEYNIKHATNLKVYKSQLLLMNDILSKIQGYYYKKCYIIGNKVKVDTVNGEFKEYNNKIGIVDLEDKNKLRNKVTNSLIWIKELKSDGSRWDIENPDRWELYPNMCNKNDSPWRKAKVKLANKLNELTQICNIGINFRKDMHHEGIFRWTDNRLVDYLKHDSIGLTIEKIIETNKGLEMYYPTSKIKSIKNFLQKYRQKYEHEFYVDFETVNSHGNNISMIYMIGCGYIKDNKWIFNSYIADSLDSKSEEKILLKWLEDMKNITNGKNNYKIYHWSYAEVTHYNKAVKKYEIEENLLIMDEWLDLLKVFRSVPICVKGAYNFGLKSIAKALYKNKLITTKWEDSELDGMAAMTVALEAHDETINTDNRLVDNQSIIEIQKYNEIDCKVLWDILLFCRKNIYKNIN